jgi:proton-dependent oligopeptide transporter, POT family
VSNAAATDPRAGPLAGEPHAHEHPRGLYTLFGAEAWERFSYYGMRALLVLYMTNYLNFERKDALEVYALYTGLVYLTPIAGGWFADKILGRRKAVLIGGILMALGHFAMAFEPLLYLALGLLIVGNGFFKPNISTVVGALYKEGDPRRDGGFTIFYMGINLGAFWAPIVVGTVGEKASWHLGFSLAGIGMGLGLAQFIWGQRHLLGVGLPPKRTDSNPNLVSKDYVDVALWVAGFAALVAAVIYSRGVWGPAWEAVPSGLKTGMGMVAGLGALYLLFRGSTKEEFQRIAVIVVLCAFNIFFWMGFEQAGGTMTLFADTQTNRDVSGFFLLGTAVVVGLGGWGFRRSTRAYSSGQSLWLALTMMFGALAVIIGVFGVMSIVKGETFRIAASQFQAINPLLIVLLAPAFSNTWERLDSGRFRTSTPTKMAIGMVILGLGFVVMYFGQSLAGTGLVSPLWLAIVYALHTIGELCLSPIGLSMVTKLAPARVVSFAMGLWFFSSAVANYLAGTLEAMLEHSEIPIYGFLVVSSIGPAVLLLALTPLLKKWMHGRA